MDSEASTPKKRGASWVGPLVVVVCGLVAYADSFRGQLFFDDLNSLVYNTSIQSLTPDFWQKGVNSTSISGRPVVTMSFALEYALGGVNLPLWHATNLAIHLGCALLLYGIVRRTLAREGKFAAAAEPLAAIVATIWVVHPLNTDAVTYMVQRTESLASLFYLGVVYGLIRGAEENQKGWGALAIASSFLAMGCKEMAVTAPAMALLYDRTFLAGTFKRALSLRRGFYIGLAASWIWLGVLLAFNGRGATVGMDQGILPLDYARTQLNVIAHYIFLAVWPRHLMLDEYGWPIARKWAEVGWGGWLVLLLAVATAVALWRRPRLGFLGAWFFVILSPSSSFVPIVTEIAAERRMYLPLAAIVALGVIGVWRATGRRLILTGLAASAVIIVLAATTLLRNEEYKSVAGIWGSVLQHNPGNPRAHLNIGEALATDGKPIDAANEYCLALECNPKFFIAASELGRLLMRTGNVDLAEQFYAHQKKSPSAMVGAARFIRGMMLAEQQRWSEAEGDFRKAANQLPGDPDVNYNFGVALQQLGQWKGAQYEFEMTLKADKNYRDAEARLAVVEAALKKSTAAGEH